VTADHAAKSWRRQVVTEIVHIVNHLEIHSINPQMQNVGDILGPQFPIVIAADCQHRSNFFQPNQNIPLADIPGVNDQFAAFERTQRLRPQQAMGV
jgi:hypothetical protein